MPRSFRSTLAIGGGRGAAAAGAAGGRPYDDGCVMLYAESPVKASQVNETKRNETKRPQFNSHEHGVAPIGHTSTPVTLFRLAPVCPCAGHLHVLLFVQPSRTHPSNRSDKPPKPAVFSNRAASVRCCDVTNGGRRAPSSNTGTCVVCVYHCVLCIVYRVLC